MTSGNGSAPGPAGGDLIAGKYRVEAQLGAGGMGVVVAARHVDLGQLFAVKIMRPELAQNVELVARFLREARAAAGLHSEHVARVHDVGKLENGTPYMVLEHLVGVDLDKLLRARGQLPIAEAIDYVLQACEAVAEAHSLGIVHRDLKPGNLFLTHRPGGSTLVKVLDFGMSKLTADGGVPEASLTAATTMLGSPWYMSPEQVRSSKSVDCRTDIWSLGVIVHKLITGRSAFEAETLSSCLAKIVADSPTALRDVRPDAPAALEAIILRCLEKDVNRRLQNVAELAWALAPFAPASSQVSVERATKVLMGPDAPADRTLVLSNSALIPVVDGSTPAPVDVASGIVRPPLASSAANAQPPAVQPSSSLSMAVLPAQPGRASRTRAAILVASLGFGALVSLVVAFAVAHRGQPTSAAPTEPVVASAPAHVEPLPSASESTATVAPVASSSQVTLPPERVKAAPVHVRAAPDRGAMKPPTPAAPPPPVKAPSKPKVSGPIETTL